MLLKFILLSTLRMEGLIQERRGGECGCMVVQINTIYLTCLGSLEPGLP